MLTISFHRVKFLLKPRCKYIWSLLDRGAILLGGNDQDLRRKDFCLSGIQATWGPARTKHRRSCDIKYTSRLLNSSTFWGRSSKGILLGRGSQCSLGFRGTPVKAGEIQLILKRTTHLKSYLPNQNLRIKPELDVFCSICFEEGIRTASRLSCRWRSPCCKQQVISCLSLIILPTH